MMKLRNNRIDVNVVRVMVVMIVVINARYYVPDMAHAMLPVNASVMMDGPVRDVTHRHAVYPTRPVITLMHVLITAPVIKLKVDASVINRLPVTVAVWT